MDQVKFVEDDLKYLQWYGLFEQTTSLQMF